VLTALVAAAGIAASFVGNAVFVIPPSTQPPLKLRIDTGGNDLVSARAAARARLKNGVAAHLKGGERGTYVLPRRSPLTPDGLLEARAGALETTFAAPVDGTLSLGRFAAQPLTIDFPRKTVTLRESKPHGERVKMTVGLGPRASPLLVPAASALVPVAIGGERVMMLLDTGADVAIAAAQRNRFDDDAATRSLPLIAKALYLRLHARHPDWLVLAGAGHMAETKRAVTLLRVPEFRIGAHRGPPTWFAVRDDPATYAYLSRVFRTKVEGDLGGEAFRRWRITIDVARETLFVD
jgi:hypothetical protein